MDARDKRGHDGGEAGSIRPRRAPPEETRKHHVAACRVRRADDRRGFHRLFDRAGDGTDRAGGELAGLPGDVFSVSVDRLGRSGAGHAIEGAAAIGPLICLIRFRPAEKKGLLIKEMVPEQLGPARETSVADLTFLPVLQRVLRRNIKSKATLES